MNMVLLRLQKYLSAQGVCSRRIAEVAIKEGRATINGKIAQLGDKVDPQKDAISFDGRRIHPLPRTPAILLLHKPKGFICSHLSQNRSPTIYQLLPNSFQKERWLCAGRLDKESEGLVVLSNHGSAIYKLTHPSQRILKHYQVTVHRPFHQKDIPKALEGIALQGEHLSFHSLRLLFHKRQLDITLQEGRKREIRRILEHLGYQTLLLKRYRIGNLQLGRLPKGQIRELSLQEVSNLIELPKDLLP